MGFEELLAILQALYDEANDRIGHATIQLMDARDRIDELEARLEELY